MDETDGAFDDFPGRGGIEILELLRGGGVGCIPGIHVFDRPIRVSRLLREGYGAAAQAVYREAEPVVVVLEQLINHFVTFSRELAARRLRLGPVAHRLAKEVPPFTVALLDRFRDDLGTLRMGSI